MSSFYALLQLDATLSSSLSQLTLAPDQRKCLTKVCGTEMCLRSRLTCDALKMANELDSRVFEGRCWLIVIVFLIVLFTCDMASDFSAALAYALYCLRQCSGARLFPSRFDSTFRSVAMWSAKYTQHARKFLGKNYSDHVVKPTHA